MLYLTETQKDGNYSSDDVLFTSETNSVIVRFTSDWGITSSGFSLDVRSISCADREQYPETGNQQEYEDHGSCDAEEVVIATGEEQQSALVTHTDSDGYYPNHACQEWSINTDDNQVYVHTSKHPIHVVFNFYG